jgi:hypothetical protein
MAVVRSLRLLTGRKAAEDPLIVAIDIAAPDEDDLAIPADSNTVSLGGLFALALKLSHRRLQHKTEAQR